MRKFEVLFDHGENSPLAHPAYAVYGQLGFPAPPQDRPWIYANFVQTLDGITSWKGEHALGSDISRSPEDRWLMDLLRAHADAVLLGSKTLAVEKAVLGPNSRGATYIIEDPGLRDLRTQLGRRREMIIFVTGSAALNLADYEVFDGDKVDAVLLTARAGAAKLIPQQGSHPHVRIMVAGDGNVVDLPAAMRLLTQECGIRLLLCEGGPTLYGYMSRAGLIDEKFLTISPVEAGQIIPQEQEIGLLEGPARLRPTTFSAPGFTADNAPWWNWISCRKVGDHEFNRYRRKTAR
ncbi:MAG TPA: dihydrofolate reductase family protein [Terriglobales bacterium]|nr:dihydrofolate reductase family protein [Terriglobales bacterium]